MDACLISASGIRLLDYSGDILPQLVIPLPKPLGIPITADVQPGEPLMKLRWYKLIAGSVGLLMYEEIP